MSLRPPDVSAPSEIRRNLHIDEAVTMALCQYCAMSMVKNE